jgi:hypothetical protein
MKIKVRPSRLLSSLAQYGFVAGPELSGQDSFTFVRRAKMPDLFEWIFVEASGKRSEAVVALVATSLTSKILDRRNLAEECLLTEIAQDQERGWTIVETQADAREWESQLVARGPLRAEQLTTERGEKLLQRTKKARQAVKRYLAHVNLTKPLAAQIAELRPNADPKQLGVAERLASWWGCEEDIFALAWLCIVSFEGQVEETPQSFAEQNPNFNSELLCRIELIADALLLSQEEGAA